MHRIARASDIFRDPLVKGLLWHHFEAWELEAGWEDGGR